MNLRFLCSRCGKGSRHSSTIKGALYFNVLKAVFPITNGSVIDNEFCIVHGEESIVRFQDTVDESVHEYIWTNDSNYEKSIYALVKFKYVEMFSIVIGQATGNLRVVDLCNGAKRKRIRIPGVRRLETTEDPESISCIRRIVSRVGNLEIFRSRATGLLHIVNTSKGADESSKKEFEGLRFFSDPTRRSTKSDNSSAPINFQLCKIRESELRSDKYYVFFDFEQQNSILIEIVATLRRIIFGTSEMNEPREKTLLDESESSNFSKETNQEETDSVEIMSKPSISERIPELRPAEDLYQTIFPDPVPVQVENFSCPHFHRPNLSNQSMLSTRFIGLSVLPIGPCLLGPFFFKPGRNVQRGEKKCDICQEQISALLQKQTDRISIERIVKCHIFSGMKQKSIYGRIDLARKLHLVGEDNCVPLDLAVYMFLSSLCIPSFWSIWHEEDLLIEARKLLTDPKALSLSEFSCIVSGLKLKGMDHLASKTIWGLISPPPPTTTACYSYLRISKPDALAITEALNTEPIYTEALYTEENFPKGGEGMNGVLFLSMLLQIHHINDVSERIYNLKKKGFTSLTARKILKWKQYTF